MLTAFDTACSVLSLFSVMDENKTKTLTPILILKPALNPSIALRYVCKYGILLS